MTPQQGPTRTPPHGTEQMPTPVPTPGPPAVVAQSSAAATQRPEKRISAMNEAQIMAKLRTVVSNEDPSLLYSKIKKVGQG